MSSTTGYGEALLNLSVEALGSDFNAEMAREVDRLIPDTYAELSRFEKDRILRELIVEVTVFPFKYVAPQVGGLLKVKLNMPERDVDFEDSLQIGQLTDMASLLTEGLDTATMKNELPMLLTSLMYYIYEIGSDNASEVTGGIDARFKYPEVVMQFSRGALGLVQGELSLREAMQLALEGIDLSHLKNATSDVVKKFARTTLASNSHIPIDQSTIDFMKDPNVGLLKLNMVSIAFAHSAVLISKERLSSIPGLKWLSDLSTTGIVRRYESGIELVQNPSTGIQRAIPIGENSILMLYAIPSFLQFTASANPERYATFMANSQELLTGISEKMALVTRAINDLGGTLENPAARDLLNRLRIEANGKSAREFLIEARENDSYAWVQSLMEEHAPKLYKDLAGEGEYNIAGNATSVSGKLGTFEAIIENLDYFEPIYLEAKKELGSLFAQVDAAGFPELTNGLLGFLYWMNVMYSRNLDFDSNAYSSFRTGLLEEISVRNRRRFVQMQDAA